MARESSLQPFESLLIDVTEDSNPDFRAQGVTCVVGDEICLTFYADRFCVPAHVVAVVDGETQEFRPSLSGCLELLMKYPGLRSAYTDKLKFVEGGGTAFGDVAVVPSPVRAASAEIVSEAPVGLDLDSGPLSPAYRAFTARPTPARAVGTTPKKATVVLSDDATELREFLEAAGLSSFLLLLTKARVSSMLELRGHSILELQESLARKDRGFVFSSKERSGFVFMGLVDDSGLKGPRASSAPPPTTEPILRPSAGASAAIREAFSGSLGGADLSRIGDILGAVDESVSGAAALPPAADHSLTTGCKLAGRLLIRCKPSELDMSNLGRLLKVVSSAFPVGEGVPLDGADTVESTIDLLEAALLEGVGNDYWSERDLDGTEPGIRDVTRRMTTMAIAARKSHSSRSRSPASGGSEIETADKDGLSKLTAALLEHSGERSMSQADLKIAAEITASEERAKAVANDPEARELLSELRLGMSSMTDPQARLDAHSAAAGRNAKLAAVLKCSNLREPKGVSAVRTPALAKVVKDALGVAQDVVEAGRKVLRMSMPANGKALALAQAAYAGAIGSSDTPITEIANPANPSPWLGAIKTAKELSTPEAMLAQLFSAIIPMQHAMLLMMPHDSTLISTLMEVLAEVAKGLRRSGAALAVESVLAPLFRELASAWTAWQKDALMEMPTLAAIWAIERAQPSVAAYLVDAARPAAAVTAPLPAATGGGSGGQQLPANLGTRIKALEKHYKDLTDDEDDSGPPKKTPSQKKKEKRERKEAKEAAEKKEKEEKKP